MIPGRKLTLVDVPWSAPELARMHQLRAEKLTSASIAGALRQEFGTGRTGQAVKMCVAMLKKREERKAERAAAVAELTVVNNISRKCLCCGGGFSSWGAGNRMCVECKRQLGHLA